MNALAFWKNPVLSAVTTAPIPAGVAETALVSIVEIRLKVPPDFSRL
ncbi:hypothetical protein [Methylocella sp.]|jgi:hypothetical protein